MAPYIYQGLKVKFLLFVFIQVLITLNVPVSPKPWPRVGTSTKSAEQLAQRAEKSCQFICADSRHPGSPFVLHPVLSAVSVPFCDLRRQLGQQ